MQTFRHALFPNRRPRLSNPNHPNGVHQTAIDWQNWLRRWEAQQNAQLPDREARFEAMLDVLGTLLPAEFVALDLASGPGAIASRLLQRFPKARCVAVDLDPVMLTMGEAALGDFGGRLRWVKADLTDPGWTSELGEATFDAVLSTTSLHWLSLEPLVRVYRDLGSLVREDGVVINGDHLPYAPHFETLRLLSEVAIERQLTAAAARADVDDWDGWWSALAQEPGVPDLIAQRPARLTEKRDRPPIIFDVHEAALRDAGFREVGTIWQRLDNRVLVAVR